MFSKILIANRGEIAVRAIRAAHELGADTVAIYPWEDRHSDHRTSADESYEIGERGRPVRAYLSVPEVVDAAQSAGADAVYPGYGFLSENPQLAAECTAAGIAFIGPDADILRLTGDKSTAIAAAKSAGLPVLASTAPSDDVDDLITQTAEMRYPLFVKAVAGGGGRGMRRVEAPEEIAEAVAAASREALSAFGDGTVFIEQAVVEPRHIEVQILADGAGNVIHLFERDCSVQRRHQKVVELAPAPNLDPALRQRICDDAVRFAEAIHYRGAGTVEFLLDATGAYYFIEMNPRIQVEHTVTEEITGVDLVAAQMRIAAGETLDDIGLRQDSIRINGAALQCRITTEDPSAGFRPDTGRITAYRSPGGNGVRLDGAARLGTEVSAHFDSMLVKVTCRGADFEASRRRALRAITEFRIRGVATNIPFLRELLMSNDFRDAKLTTAFIERHPELLAASSSADSGTRLLTYLADVVVNRPHGERPTSLRPRDKLPTLPSGSPASGSRQLLQETGPEEFCRRLRVQNAVAVTDTTFRDAHQSILATRIRTSGLAVAAPAVSALTPQLLSVECWGGATYDVALRFLDEDPWERLDTLRAAMPNLCLQMLLRGDNTVGYEPYPAAVTKAFVQEAAASGIDIFRIFDALNNVDRMRTAIDAVRDCDGPVAEVALCYTGDLSHPGEKLYTLDYYLRLAEQIVEAGAHMLAIKDMAGLLRPAAAITLVNELRSNFDLPVHLHTHDTAGGQLGTYLAAIGAGVDAVDAASAPLSGGTSQPSMSALVAACAGTVRPTELDLDAVCALEPYWEAVRQVYAPFESGIAAPTGRVYKHEIPGGQLSNLRQQAQALGLSHRFEDIEQAYADADRLLGRIIKVTPTSKVVGDLALALVGAGVSADDFAADPSAYDIPDSVIGFLEGELGTPAAGWPEPLRSRALAGRTATNGAAAVTDEQQAALPAGSLERRVSLNHILFPGPARQFYGRRAEFGQLDRLPASLYFYGMHPGEEHRVRLSPGIEVFIELEAISEPDAAGMRTVMFRFNGQHRPVRVLDRSTAADIPRAEKADPTNPLHVAAPYGGVVQPLVGAGDRVDPGGTIATIEAMKMESSIGTQTGGIVERLVISGTVAEVAPGDLIAVMRPA
ncbi:pyruvate carboxylase [Jongsikchunia kroppenstedtii]|uniref:pyruvate carboxylase n=1 Tax=Jongsikchunia kroppenstedtii TaxID=1121721 RepID=UPI00036686E4|nr:pyruvate carboxylase [Jongsikchunia kroppenstedtii]